MTLIATAISAHITRQNLEQSTMAQNLLGEHLVLSSVSYRLFKQLTDELIFGQNANQADVRNKENQIAASLDRIRELELQQREALGVEVTEGSVEDTEDLARLLDTIIEEFRAIVASQDSSPLSTQSRVQRLLEVTIDNQFREAIDSAVRRQSTVVASINSRIDTLNTAIVWFTVAFGLVSVPLVVLACTWLLNQLYQPLSAIRQGAEAIAIRNYNYRLPETLDKEFQQIVLAFNSMANQLSEHESKAEQSRRQLEFAVAQRTRELTEANQRLTHIDSRRRQFLADLSHELRTPLTVIRGEAQVTLRQNAADSDAYRQTLDNILTQAVGLSRLVDDLLLLARAEISQLTLDVDVCDLTQWLKSQASHWSKVAHTHSFLLQLHSESIALPVKADLQRLAQVLAILIDNAIKYSPENTQITLSTQIESGRVGLTVSDQGYGIAPADLGPIFERFVRLNRRGDGAGLGLAIARTIIEAHG
ncbi:MAG: HAMP domain-containing histidine kinase, partial [Gammaproteobacteria bacterium]|nr:HAMP domain-containing histidine kinase [Gammaproteobacteria bacterium]